MKFINFDKVTKEMAFNSRSWNYQKVIRYLLKDNDNRIIESMAIWHYKDDKLIEFILELSNMYNCPVQCQFCASGALDKAPCLLTSEDFKEQIKIMLDDCQVNPHDFPKFSISFTGIGEPSLVYQELSIFMTEIQKIYSHVTYIIGTFGYNPKCFSYWLNDNLRIKTLQIPFYTDNEAKLKQIVPRLPHDYTFKKVLHSALKYKQEAVYNCRVKVNFLTIFENNK